MTDAKNWDQHAISESRRLFPVTGDGIDPVPMPAGDSARVMSADLVTCGCGHQNITKGGKCPSCGSENVGASIQMRTRKIPDGAVLVEVTKGRFAYVMPPRDGRPGGFIMANITEAS